jgi:hypothetical protein
MGKSNLIFGRNVDIAFLSRANRVFFIESGTGISKTVISFLLNYCLPC